MSSKLLILLAALMPVCVMVSPSLPSTVFYLLLAAGLWVLVQHRFAGARDFSVRHWGLLACMGAPVLAVLFSGAWHGDLQESDLEAGLRFLGGVWILGMAYSCIRPPQLRQATWGFVLAAVAATAFVFFLAWTHKGRPDTDAVYNAVGYGSLTALLMTLVVYSLLWKLSPWPPAELALKLLVAVLALGAVVLTQTRTAWLAMPIFVVVGVVLFLCKASRGRMLLAIVVILLGVTTLFLSNDHLRTRAVQAYQQTLACTGTAHTAKTSICIRLQLWRAALDMAGQRPVAGNGSRRNFDEYLERESLPKGIVSPFVAKGWGEPHNDLLLALASYGIPGGIALLLIYLGPAWVFFRRLSHRYATPTRVGAAMGLALCLGFLVFGLPETMFRSMRTVGFYSACVALFLALSDPEAPSNRVDSA